MAQAPSTSIAAELVGRIAELKKLQACLRAGKNVLLEGPVGVGKTHLAIAVTQELKRPVFRIDGDNRYSEQKLSGWFDPPTVIKKGFSAESFIPGPLVEAMKVGGVLFINELNRLPEGVQNVLLPAIDERMILVPRLGEIRAKPGFLVIATQNPKEFVATSHLSEAILDRFELVMIQYQSEEDEIEIVSHKTAELEGSKKSKASLSLASVRLIRATRVHPRIRRGASVRAAISMAQIATVLISDGATFEEAFLAAALMALPTRIEIEREMDSEQSIHAEIELLLKEMSESVLSDLNSDGVKKKL
ncbi:MAG: MoxR family ATPase [Methylotenera sp.]|nr:MoxR family ATPase [Oligoflexia bacterium]